MLHLFKVIKDIFTVSGNILDKAGQSMDLASDSTAVAKKITKVAGIFERLSNAVTKLKYKSPRTKAALELTKQAFNFIFSPKVARIVGIGLAIFAFVAAASTPPGAIALLTASTVGFVAKVASEVNQKRNLRKVQAEEKALARLVKNKHKAIGHANIVNLAPSLAKDIGLSSLTLPNEDQNKLSKLDRKKLIADLKNPKLGLLPRAKMTEQLELLDKQVISSQKYTEGKSTRWNAAKKVFKSGGLKLIGDLSTMAAHASNPVGLTLAVGSSVVGFIGETNERHEISDQKQALKNSIELFRKRPDVPGYDSLEELQAQSRQAKLEAKALEKLVTNEKFLGIKAELDATQDPAEQKSLIDQLKQIVTNAKHEVIFEERAKESSGELKSFLKEKSEAIAVRVEHKLAQEYQDYYEKAKTELSQHDIADPSEKQILQAMKELAKKNAKEEINSAFKGKQNGVEISIKEKGNESLLHLSSSTDKKLDIITQYEAQDSQTRWEKFKKLAADAGDTFNVFSNEELTVKRPHQLLVQQHLSEFAIHHSEKSSSESIAQHKQALENFNKDKKAVMSIHAHLMEKALLSDYAISARKILAAPTQPPMAHKSSEVSVGR